MVGHRTHGKSESGEMARNPVPSSSRFGVLWMPKFPHHCPVLGRARWSVDAGRRLIRVDGGHDHRSPRATDPAPRRQGATEHHAGAPAGSSRQSRPRNASHATRRVGLALGVSFSSGSNRPFPVLTSMARREAEGEPQWLIARFVYAHPLDNAAQTPSCTPDRALSVGAPAKGQWWWM